MKAILVKRQGEKNILEYSEIPKPQPGPDDLLIQVHATALNRIDLAQRYGIHKLPQYSSPILGIEVAGRVVEIGSGVTDRQIGDRVFGLVNGGGYAQFCLMDQQMAFLMPDHWEYQKAAAVSEVFLTASERLFTNGRLHSGQSVLIHAGGSGVGTAAIQLAHYVGARVYITAGSDEKITKCLTLGADWGVNYKTHDFVKMVFEKTDRQGLDLVLDCIGPAYLNRNIQVLKPDGKLLVMGLLSGTVGEIDLKQVLVKRVAIIGNNLYLRKIESQREIAKRFSQQWLPLLREGKIKPIIDRCYAIEEVDQAHQRMRTNLNFGKIILEVTH